LDLSCCECIAEPIGVVAFITQKRLSLWKSVDHQRRTAKAAHLTFAKQQDQWSTLAITHGVQLGVQATLGAPDTYGSAAK
jgi:hypothetical protein